MDPIVVSAGSALVGAMATDGWERARTALVSLWRRARPEQADTVGAELAAVRAQLLVARNAGDADTEEALAGSWRLRLQELLAENPALTDELRRLLDQELTPAMTTHTQADGASTVINANASGNSRMFVAGRDQHITG
ncbi:hypothetical protein [Streptomyces lancefieldiae]|uniref:Uncharacterized protein n=1 Tax=Streptomyces lancefieldiae TaxID=3075520 RepID=A0ABU3AHW1_9ACTN|nr:hypothetical protein [Streptomyces sp. DSM 40712]MDT0608668.1 hypothetical protein [Streptomyces sp. DSM 40712]